jgi:hypothetical protein
VEYENVCLCKSYQVNYILSPSVPPVFLSTPTLFPFFWQQVLTDTKEKYSINAESPNGSWENNFYSYTRKKRRRKKMEIIKLDRLILIYIFNANGILTVCCQM